MLGASCTGKLPNTTYQPDGKLLCATNIQTVGKSSLRSTKADGTPGVIKVEMRYSPGCNSIWARIPDDDPSSFYGELSVWIPGQPSQKAWITGNGQFTPMIRGGSDVTNCMGMQIWEAGRYRNWAPGFCG